MKNYIIRRLVQILVTAWIIVTIVFVAVRFAPGDPAAFMLGRMGSVTDYQLIRSYMGLDRPIHVQYFEYFNGLLKGDLGPNCSQPPAMHFLDAALLLENWPTTVTNSGRALLMGQAQIVLASTSRRPKVNEPSACGLSTIAHALLADPPTRVAG